MHALGRRKPQDFEHVHKYPFSAIQPSAVESVEKTLKLPWWHWRHDQGREGACVGFGLSMMLSILNESQNRAQGVSPITRHYDARWLWNRAKEVDFWEDTNPGDDNGTSVRAGCDILRTRGHVLLKRTVPQPESVKEGIATNRWARNSDEIRTCIASGIPCTIGVDWYSNFDSPIVKSNAHWIGEGNLGSIRGGHALCVYGASDRRQAFKLKNSWGKDYPLVWLPYTVMDQLLNDWGEATLVTDR